MLFPLLGLDVRFGRCFGSLGMCEGVSALLLQKFFVRFGGGWLLRDVKADFLDCLLFNGVFLNPMGLVENGFID